MFELITQILILVGIYFLVRFVLLTWIDRKYLTWMGGLVLVLLMVLAFFDPTNRTVGILWGVLSFPLRPLGLSLLLLGYALSAGTKKVRGPQVMSALLILLISSLPLTAYLLTAQTEQKTALDLSQRPVDRDVPAIVILGDGTTPSNPAYRLRSQLSNIADGLSVTLQSRLLYAGQLYAEQRARGISPIVIVSAGPQPILAQPNLTSEQVITNFLVQRAGIPAEQIRVDSEGIDPRSSAIAVRKLLSPGSVPGDCRLYAVCDNTVQELPTTTAAGPRIPIELVTPALGLRRAASTFARLNFAIIPKPTDFYVFQSQAGLRLAALTDLIPSSEALTITSRVVDEYFATVYYFLRGWLTDPLGV
jgi:uncharacterized SAM-binding protein YcdF (DUF218 family)